MAKVVRLHETGGPEVLRIEDLPSREPGRGEVRLRGEAIALNRAETLFPFGQYLEPAKLPARIGCEARSSMRSAKASRRFSRARPSVSCRRSQ